MKKFLNEFKAFISRGNVMDMAVGVIIGASFKAIVDSLVADIINPLLGIFGKKDFSQYVLQLPGEATLNYGNFISSIINFLIMAFIIFCIIKLINGMNDMASKIGKKKEEEAPKAPTTKTCPFCKSEIAIDATRCPHCTSEQPEE
jgi:large conductance mechanosensitive channel